MSFDFPDSEPPSQEPIVAEVVAEPADGSEQNDGPASSFLFLHWTSLLFELLSQVKSYLVPAALGLLGAAQGELVLIFVSAIIFIPAFLTCVFRYFTFRYRIEDDHLIVRQGLIFKSVRTIPVHRIQNIDFVQNLLHRGFDVAEVKIETASGTKPEATMRVLSMAQLSELRRSVFDRKSEMLQAGAGEALVGAQQTDAELGTEYALPGSPAPSLSSIPVATADGVGSEPKTTQPLLEIPLSWLVHAGLASNRGMIMVGVLFGLYFQFGGDRAELFVTELEEILPKGMSTFWVVSLAIIGSVVALALFRILGVGWYILRFFGYQLIRRGEDLRISCGLFTKVSATIPRKRIQFISIQQNLILRWLGYSSIRIETAGGATNSQQDATESVSKRWFIPVIPTDKVPEILTSLRPGLSWDESSLDFRPMASRAGWRLCRLAVFYSILIGVAGVWAWRPWGGFAGVVALPFLLVWAFKKAKSMNYARGENIVVYRSGVFTKKTSLTFFEKIQALSVDQTPFDRRWKMAKLHVDTAAAGQAEHLIKVPYLDEDFAYRELQSLRSSTGQQQPVFG